MELWIRAIQATCNIRACEDPNYPNCERFAASFPEFIWYYWMHTS